MIHQLKSTQDKALHLYLDDEEVIFHYLGEYEDHKWYTKTVWGPSEGSLPLIGFDSMTREEAINTIKQYLLFNMDTISMTKISPSDRHGINLFFGEEVV